MSTKKQILKGRSRLLVSITMILILTSAGELFCQEKDVKSEYEKEFEQFKKSIQEDFIEFKSRNDSIFSVFLKNAWKEYDLSTEERKVIPKPVTQPVIEVEQIKSKEIVPVHRKTMMEDTARQLQLNLAPKIYDAFDEVPEMNMTVDFYGTSIQMPKPQDSLPELTTVSGTGISDWFGEAMENKELYDIIKKVYNESLMRELNGWGLMKLMQEASGGIYDSVNDRVLFTWFGLLKCKINAKVGYDTNNIYLLAAFDVPVFYKPYFQAGKERYYLIDFDGQDQISKRIHSYETIHPGAKKLLSLQFRCLPKLEQKAVFKEYAYNNKPVMIAYDTNMVNFFNNYPNCDISVYFQPPLTEEAFNSLDKIIKPNIQGKDIPEKVNFLLAFVQKAILYETDDQQFGYENYLFAEELLSMDAADCEDRSIFLAQLIDHYVPLRMVGLEYPGHFTMAVNVPGNPEGYYVKIYDDRYYVCDPTYIGAKLGMLMPRFEDKQPEIIDFH